MESHPKRVTNRFSRSRTRNSDNWKRNVAKRLRYSSKNLPERLCEHNTKAHQCASISMNEMKELHQNFYSRTNKLDQDTLLLKYCSIVPVQRRKDYKESKQTTIKYFVFVGQKKVPICQNFFLSIFGITKHRISYVMKRFYYTGQSATENRGGDRKTHLFEDQRNSIDNFIQKLQCTESHYCRNTKNTKRYYLPAELNITKLYKLYKSCEYAHPKVKQSYFRKVFNTSYNIGFGSPKTDACSICLELTEKIKAETNTHKKNILITEKRVHSLRAKAFFEKLRDTDPDLKIISFDCQKNLPLPKLPDQITYYSRQLYFYNLTMVEGSSKQPMTKDNVFSYFCTENQFNKDSNLISSALYHRLTNTDKTGITKIRLVADGCGGQNKNCVVIGTCSKWLLENRTIKSIELVFPVTGHSFMPADRQFGIIERKLRHMEVILHPDEIKNVINETCTLIELGKDCAVKDWRETVKSVVKLTTSWNMRFKECKRFVLKRSKKEGNVLIRGEMVYKSDMATPMNVCQRQKTMSMINPKPLPNIASVNKNKLKDVEKLLCKHFGVDWKSISSLSFYVELLTSQENLTALPEAEEQQFCDESPFEVTELRI